MFAIIVDNRGFPGGSEVKAYACNAGDLGSIPGLGRSPGEGNGNPLLYSCLENPMGGGAWWATVHRVAKSQTWLNDFSFTFTIAFINYWLDYTFFKYLQYLAISIKIEVTHTQLIAISLRYPNNQGGLNIPWSLTTHYFLSIGNWLFKNIFFYYNYLKKLAVINSFLFCPFE